MRFLPPSRGRTSGSLSSCRALIPRWITVGVIEVLFVHKAIGRVLSRFTARARRASAEDYEAEGGEPRITRERGVLRRVDLPSGSQKCIDSCARGTLKYHCPSRCDTAQSLDGGPYMFKTRVEIAILWAVSLYTLPDRRLQ